MVEYLVSRISYDSISSNDVSSFCESIQVIREGQGRINGTTGAVAMDYI